jgi:hypothetical protein
LHELIRINSILISLLVFCGLSLKAQETLFDSLAVKAGFEKPIILAQYDLSFEGNEENLSAGSLLKQFMFPCDGNVISQFGYRSGRVHTGTDIKMPKGDTIYAAFSGIITCSKYYYGYGNLVVIRHENNLETYYGHLSKFLVKSRSKIKKGEPIGLAGATGRATTSHLHFEVRENDQPYDPELIFDFGDKTMRPNIIAVTSLAELIPVKDEMKFHSDKSASQQYIVRSGDSLWIISQRVKTSVKSLCLLNNISESAVLQIGQVLNIN